MSNVIQFPRVMHRCSSAKEAESFFHLLTNGKAKCIHVVRNSKREWLVTIEYWKAERMSDVEIAAQNLTREVARWHSQ